MRSVILGGCGGEPPDSAPTLPTAEPIACGAIVTMNASGALVNADAGLGADCDDATPFAIAKEAGVPPAEIETCVPGNCVTCDDWTPVAGTPTLTPGERYFLDPANPGGITTAVTTTSMTWLVPVGHATTPDTLCFAPGDPVQRR